MPMNLENVGRDWAVSITDLLLAVSAQLAAIHALSGTILPNFTDFNTQSNLVAINYMLIALAATLGFIRWGFIPKNKTLNTIYSNSVDVATTVALPYLIACLITQPFVTHTQIFAALVILFVTVKMVNLSYDTQDLIGQLITVLPILGVSFEAVTRQSFFLGIVSAVFALLPVTMKQSGIPAFHVVLSFFIWVLESARNDDYARYDLMKIAY